MEELHGAQQQRQEGINKDQQEKQEQCEEREKRSAEKIQQAKTVVEELFWFIIEDGGRWRFKAKEGRTGAKITRDHLESVFVATGQRVPEGRMESLLQAAQELTRWDEEALVFRSRLLWNDDRKSWWFFGTDA